VHRDVPREVHANRCTRNLLARRRDLSAHQIGVLMRFAVDRELYELLRALHDAHWLDLCSRELDRVLAELEFVSGREFPHRVYAMQQFLASLGRCDVPPPPPLTPPPPMSETLL
jgi:hypothetical protein